MIKTKKVLLYIIVILSGFLTSVSPWIGGAWESLIRSVKCALKVIVYDTIFAEEPFYTFLYEIESLLNSRSLTNKSEDPNDHSALTPNHILLWQESDNYNPDNFIDGEINLREKWRAAQAVQNMFWR